MITRPYKLPCGDGYRRLSSRSILLHTHKYSETDRPTAILFTRHLLELAAPSSPLTPAYYLDARLVGLT